MNDRMPTKDVLYDISSMGEFAKQLLGKNKEYEELLKYIIEQDYYNDEDKPLPTIKQLEKETGLKYTVIRRLIQ